MDGRIRRRPSKLYRAALWWNSWLYALRLGGGAAWGATTLFTLSACVSYGMISANIGPSQLTPERARPPETRLVTFVEYYGPERVEASATKESKARPGMRVITGHIQAGSTLGNTLGSEGVSAGVIDQVSRAMRPVFDFRHARAGDFFSLIQDGQGEVLSFEYQRGRRTIYRVERDAQGELQASRGEVPLERRVVQLGGTVERSLFESVIQLGEGAELAQNFADVFIWDFDFSRQTRPGDEFRMVFEKFYDREGFVRYGTVLAGNYRSGPREFTALYFESKDGYGDYYSPDGNSVRRTFLRAPLKYTRISSRYTKSRLHPILKIRRPHEGIDYAAPHGTPVWSVADGVVVHKGWSGGFGRLVKIRHNNGYTSYYGHLSAYANGIAVGKRVSQKQVIGRVGSTGLSTGPHLDYRLNIDGRFVDPLKLRFPSGRPVSVKAMSEFEEIRAARMAQLQAASPPLVLEAKNAGG